MDKIKTFLPPIEKCPIISFTMRLFSYLVCLILGFIMTVMAISELCFYDFPHYRNFALWYSLSNIIWLISTFILVEPRENYKRVLSEELDTKFIILCFFIILSLLLGFLASSKGVNIFLSLLQFGSVLAFAFSYITYSPNKESDNIDNPYQNNNLFNELK